MSFMKTPRLLHLDIIRGIAALSVFFAHFHHPISIFINNILNHTIGVNNGLHFGVVIFIVLSGFCIHLPNAEVNNLSDILWKKYFLKRFFRVVPVLIVGILLGLLVYNISFFSESEFNIFHLVKLYFKLIVVNPFYFIGLNGPIGNIILATVIVELWLYVTYPIVFYLARKFGLILTFFFACLLYLIPFFCSFGLQIKIDGAWLISSSYYGFLILWIMGFISAELLVRYKKFIKNDVLIWIALCTLYFTIGTIFKFDKLHYLLTPMLGLIVAIFLLKYEYLQIYFPNCGYLLIKIFVYIGTISYSLYAIHLPIITVLDSKENYNINFCIILVSVLLTYYIIEKPFMLMMKKL